MLYYYPNRPLLLSPDHPRVIKCSNDLNFDAEIKKNGDRLVLRKPQKSKVMSFNGLNFFNRQNKVLKYTPCSELLDELDSLRLPLNTQLDGELMHFHTKHLKHIIFLYDVYYFDNVKMRGTLTERRQIISDLFGGREFKHIFISETFDSNFPELYKNVIKEKENEGLVIKDKRGKIVFNTHKSLDVDWQIKIRKSTKNYKF